ncbi:uncharacterized protein Dvar_70570 [Desulfosarcina variabilis str. Montpellier]|uniref:hypothetical protein n=1 Tax=Desulfosarcina variabilis TaxID=2300 RepID=UPI003AFA9ADE
MGHNRFQENQRIARVVEERAGVGTTEVVAGWQAMLVDLLRRMRPFMRPGVLVTFKDLLESEIAFFERLHRGVRIPQSAVAIYLPPSVRQQMLGEAPASIDGTGQPDAGVVVASHHGAFDVIVNALFAYPPYTPAIDVYDQGELAAGYQFKDIDACRKELPHVLGRHLGVPFTKS